MVRPPVSRNCCHKGANLRNVCPFCLSFSFLLTGQDRDCFCFTFVLFEHSLLLFWIQRCTTYSSPPCLQKEEIIFRRRRNLRGPVLHQIDSQYDCCLPSSAFRMLKLTPRSRSKTSCSSESNETRGTHLQSRWPTRVPPYIQSIPEVPSGSFFFV